VAEQVGRAVAPVPYLSTILGGALPVAEHGSAVQRARLLPGVIAGELTLSPALHEPGLPDVPAVPRTAAVEAAGTWRLDGEKAVVVGAQRAAALLVPARTEALGPDAVTVLLVDPAARGVTVVPELAVTGEPRCTVRFEGVEVGADAVLGRPGEGAAVARWVLDRLRAGACAMQTGVCEEALAITARYVSEREQFGTKLGTFQAVGHRVADAYIDTEAIRLTALQAIWRLDRGLDATEELLVAKFWASEGAQRIVHAAQHLHGGIGMDLDYPIHRYFRWAKVLELELGGATPSLLGLGASLAGRAVGAG
jgi:acyl-CoA dehydrogenase